jgi:hypothetical protein
MNTNYYVLANKRQEFTRPSTCKNVYKQVPTSAQNIFRCSVTKIPNKLDKCKAYEESTEEIHK